MTRFGTWRRTTLVGTALTLVGVAAAPSHPGPHPNRPPPRVVNYQPRIAIYQPRIVDETPKMTAPTTVTVGADILFAFDSAGLSPQAKTVLGQIVTQLKTVPAGQVVVTGYTDSIGDPSYNLTLSQQRAAAVQQYLAQQVNRPDLSYQAVGEGEADPVAPNTNPDGSDNPVGRAQNRRVTVAIPAS